MEHLTVPLTSQDDEFSPHTKCMNLTTSTTAQQDTFHFRSPALSTPETHALGESWRLTAETGVR